MYVILPDTCDNLVLKYFDRFQDRSMCLHVKLVSVKCFLREKIKTPPLMENLFFSLEILHGTCIN